MQSRDPLSGIIDEMNFEKKLMKLYKMTPEEKRRHMYQIDEREKAFAHVHGAMNEYILELRQFEDDVRRENPDGDWEDE